jgi:hypothetical protein
MYRGAVWKGIKQYWKSLGEGHMGDAFERVHIDKHGNWRYGAIPYGIPLDNQALECMNHHNVKEPLRNKQRAVAAQAVAAATQAAGPSPVQSQPALNPKAAAKLPCSSDIAFDAYVDHLRVVSQRTELEIQNETDFNFHKRYSSLEVKEGEVIVVSVVFVRAPMPLYKKKRSMLLCCFFNPFPREHYFLFCFLQILVHFLAGLCFVFIFRMLEDRTYREHRVRVQGAPSELQHQCELAKRY